MNNDLNLQNEALNTEEYAEANLILSEDLNAFISNFREFEKILNTQEEINKFESLINRLKCLYPEFSNLERCNIMPFFLLIAHYAVFEGLAKDIGLIASDGVISSSSVGDVSVSFQTSPYSQKGDDFTYFLSLTPYGMQYLAWLSRRSGLSLVN